MANHKSAKKRIRSDEKKRDRNRYQHKTTRNAIRDLRASTDAKEATEMLTKVSSIIKIKINEDERNFNFIGSSADDSTGFFSGF